MKHDSKSCNSLRDLVLFLQQAIRKGGLNEKQVKYATEELATLKYTYDEAKFPKLTETKNFSAGVKDTPQNLAEALLWKLGKWPSYRTFAKQYSDSDNQAQPSSTSVVFFAFAKHLKDPDKNPIYDQHTLRAMWAINLRLNDQERSCCKEVLMNGENKWKAAGSGNSAAFAYKLFQEHFNDLSKAESTDATAKGIFDRLLMPLGQALKDCTKDYDAFYKLCGQWQCTSNEPPCQPHCLVPQGER